MKLGLRWYKTMIAKKLDSEDEVNKKIRTSQNCSSEWFVTVLRDARWRTPCPALHVRTQTNIHTNHQTYGLFRVNTCHDSIQIFHVRYQYWYRRYCDFQHLSISIRYLFFAEKLIRTFGLRYRIGQAFSNVRSWNFDQYRADTHPEYPMELTLVKTTSLSHVSSDWSNSEYKSVLDILTVIKSLPDNERKQRCQYVLSVYAAEPKGRPYRLQQV